MKIHSLAEANQILSRYRPTDLETAYTLDRMQALMQQLDEPQHKYKVIHVAGTAGKTSTSYFLAALLAQAGQKVGLTVSPHLDDVNDRVQLNGAPLREELFCKYLSQFLGLEPVREIKPTYFELLVAFAFWVFAQ